MVQSLKSTTHVQILQKLTQIQMLKLLKYQKRYIIKEEVIETIQKIYYYSKEKYKKKKKVHQPIKQ